MQEAPPFTIGIEEEYLLVDQETLALAKAPDGLIEACKSDPQAWVKAQVEKPGPLNKDYAQALSAKELISKHKKERGRLKKKLKARQDEEGQSSEVICS